MALAGDVDQAFELLKPHVLLVIVVDVKRSVHNAEIQDSGAQRKHSRFGFILARQFSPLRNRCELLGRQIDVMVLRVPKTSIAHQLQIAALLQQLRIDHLDQ